MRTDLDFRANVLRACGAKARELDELLLYTQNAFAPVVPTEIPHFPLPDEPFVAAWEGYAAEARDVGTFPSLQTHLIQLRFPIAEGISASAEYHAAARRGEFIAHARGGIELRAPERLELRLHVTPAGRIPILVAAERDDFVTLVRAFTRRNEPSLVPDSMGACIVAGYNNWDRIHKIRLEWEAANPEAGVEGWEQVFRQLISRKELYQDRFILLSRGPYSAVRADQLGLPRATWEDISFAIRLEHECTHYFTRRVFGSMRNSLHDELIADFSGIVASIGRFRSDWLLRFMGLDDYPHYREGARLQNYRGDPPLSEPAFLVIQTIVKRAAEHLDVLAARGLLPMSTPIEKANTLYALAHLPLEALASPTVIGRFCEAGGRHRFLLKMDAHRPGTLAPSP